VEFKAGLKSLSENSVGSREYLPLGKSENKFSKAGFFGHPHCCHEEREIILRIGSRDMIFYWPNSPGQVCPGHLNIPARVLKKTRQNRKTLSRGISPIKKEE